MKRFPFGTREIRGVTLREAPARETCFECVDLDKDMYEWPDMSPASRRERLHRHMNNETGAMEIAAMCLVEHTDAPWDLRMRLARQTADEARHTMLLYRRVQEIGGHKGEFPVANYEWGVTGMIDNLPGKLAVQNRTFEAGLIDILGSLRTIWREAGDDTTAEMLDSILADEITHVRFANRWIRKLTAENPRILLQVALAVRFLGRANDNMAIREGEVNKAGIPLQPKSAPAVNVEDRREAEFSEEEILEVLKQAGFRSILPIEKKENVHAG